MSPLSSTCGYYCHTSNYRSSSSSTCTDWAAVINSSMITAKTYATKLNAIKASTTWSYGRDLLAEEEEAFYAGNTRKLNSNMDYLLPDGSKLKIDDKGNYSLEDKDAKITYLANRIKEFNPYINSSDLLAKFVEYCGSLNLRRQEVLKLPVELFISWLILEASKHDDETPPPDVVPIPRLIGPTLKPRCLVCKRFIPRVFAQKKFEFCNSAHSELYFSRLN